MNLKRITLLLALLFVILHAITFARWLWPSEKIVYVDSNQLLESYEGMKAARKEFQQKATQWQANIDTLKAELDREIQQYEKEKARMRTKECQLSEKLIGSKRQQFIDYQKGIQQKSQQEDYQMTEAVLTEVNAFIATYGKEHGYTLILGANSSGNIIYGEDYLNITEDLKAALNAHYTGL